MISIDEVEIVLDEIAEEIPKEFFKELNGGILLLPQAKKSPYARADDLWIMGEYQYSHSMGRLINIYYGSFEKLYGNISIKRLKYELREVLLHEFTHHLESLAGEKGLEKKDAERLARYQGNKRKE